MSSGMCSPGRRQRRRCHVPSSQLITTEIQGQAYLYFSEDYTWFQGNINTDGESNYSIYGEIDPISPNVKSKFQSSVSANSTSSTGSSTPYESDDELDLDNVPRKSEDEGQFCLFADSVNPTSETIINLNTAIPSYRITLTDHYTGLIYHFPTVLVNRHATENESLLLSYDPKVSMHFTTENIYKGQMAAIVIQRSLGNSSGLLGKKTIVYAGEMQLRFSDDYINAGQDWSL